MSDQSIAETAQDAPPATEPTTTPEVTEQPTAPQEATRTAEQSTPAPVVEDPDATPTEPADEDTPPAEPAEDAEDAETPDEDTAVDNTEEDTRDPRITKARAEAAKYRHRAREAETTLATVTAERDEALAKLATIEHDRLALDACRAAHIPDAMAAHLTGTTPDEITASARTMSAAIGYDRGPVDPSQGRGTGGDSGTGPGGQTTWADVLGTGNHDL